MVVDVTYFSDINIIFFVLISGKSILKTIIESMNVNLLNEINKSSLVAFNYSVFNYFYAMINNEQLAELFLESSFPQPINVGSKYSLTVLGSLFNLSVLPKAPMGKYEYFLNPMDQVSLFF